MGTAETTEPPGQMLLVVNVVVVGPFEVEGIGAASDAVKVKGENWATLGSLREERARRNVGDFKSWVHAPWLAREEILGSQ